MTPLDDELRRALTTRAVRIAPAQDPFPGIEQRARRMRRTRAASVAAVVALFVGGAAVAVPAVLDSTGTDASPTELLTQAPEPAPSASERVPEGTLPFYGSTGALDPGAPWPYRGVELGTRGDEVEQEVVRHYPGSTYVPLFGQVVEYSDRLEVVFLAQGTAQGDLWGVVQESAGSGPDVAWIQPLAAGATALAAALPGDDGARRLLLVADPTSTEQTYFPGNGFPGGGPGVALAELAPGVGTLGMSGDPRSDLVEVRLPSGTADGLGELRYRDLAPDLPSQDAEPGVSPTAAADRPAGAVEWPSAPLDSTGLDAGARTAYTDLVRVPSSAVRGEQLWIGLLPDGTQVGWYQLWTGAANADVVLAAERPDGGVALPHRVRASRELGGLAAAAQDAGGSPWVVALGAPGTDEIAYAEDGARFVGLAQTRSHVFPRTGPAGSPGDAVRFSGSGTQFVVALGPPNGPSQGAPSNAVDWPRTGSPADERLVATATSAFARALGAAPADLTFRPLLVTDFDGGLRLVAGQAWLAGKNAYPVSYAVGGSCPASTFVGREIPAGAKVLAFALNCVPGRTTDTVMVVPQPQTGQVEYGAEGSEYRPVGFLPGLEPVVEIERDPAGVRGTDMLRVFDGDGREPSFEGPLDTLLCGIKECG